jgi:hypothetical protein
VQRLTTQRNPIWEALFRGVCYYAVRKFWIHASVRSHCCGKLPRGRHPYTIQRLLQKHRQWYILPSYHRIYPLNFLPVHVHISNLAAQTGASLFLQTHSAPYHPSLPSPSSGLNWTYNKTENLTTYSPSRFTHLIIEASEPVPRGWKKVECVEGFDGLSLMPSVFFSPKKDVDTVGFGTLLRVSRQILTMKMSDKLCILETS